MTEIAQDVLAVATALVERIDYWLPGQLEAFYLTGSVAQGDYRDGVSDIDFVAVLAGSYDVFVLSEIHADISRYYSSPGCDGIYLQPGDLAKAPSGMGPCARDGLVSAWSTDERNPVAWLMLADNGIAFRGQKPGSHWIIADRTAVIEYSRQNMQTYWRDWLDKRRRLLSAAGLSLLSDNAVAWGALGVARVYATIQSGRVPTKSAAGEHGTTAFPAHDRIIAEALRLRCNPRSNSGYSSPMARRRDLIAFMDTVIKSI